jgi:hypothetical protein
MEENAWPAHTRSVYSQFFKPACQFNTTVMGCGLDSCAAALIGNLSVGGHIPDKNIAGKSTEGRIDEPSRDAGLERPARSCIHSHHCPIVHNVEKFLAVPPPARLRSAIVRNRERSAPIRRSRKGPHIDFGLAGLVRALI